MDNTGIGKIAGTRMLVALVAALAMLLLASPAAAQGPSMQGSGTGVVTDIAQGERTDLGRSGNWVQTRTLTGFIDDGPLDGTFEQTVRGVVRDRTGFVTFSGTLTFTGTIEGCGDEEHTVTLGVSGRGQANPPVTEARVRVIGPPSDGLHITGHGTVNQEVLGLTYDIEYRCR